MTRASWPWEDKADESSRFMRTKMQRYLDKHQKVISQTPKTRFALLIDMKDYQA